MNISLKQGDTVLLDTAPILYYWQRHHFFSNYLDVFFDTIYQKDIQCTIPMATYTELVSVPMEDDEFKLAAKCREYLTNSSNFTIYPFNLQVADRAAVFMHRHNLPVTIASKLATAEICGADYLLTENDTMPDTIDAFETQIIRLPSPPEPTSNEELYGY